MKAETAKNDASDALRALQSPFCRGAELAQIFLALSNDECRAVFLAHDAGLGASTTLRRLDTEASVSGVVLLIHGTPSLKNVSYGALAPYLGRVVLEAENIRVNVLRAVLSSLEERRATLSVGEGTFTNRALIIIDDAHSVDSATAELIVNLVLAGTVNVVASHLTRESLPAPLPKLWVSGVAESIELLPLTKDQGHDYCTAMLGGPVATATSWYFWASAAGNVLLLRSLITEATARGLMHEVNGLWVCEQGRPVASVELRDVIGQQIRGLSARAKEALELVALAEPVGLDTVTHICGSEAVDEIVKRQFVSESALEEGILRLVNAVYGEVMRSMIQPAQSRLLYSRLLPLESGLLSTEAVLRRTVWSVDGGMDVSEEQLLQAAIFAGKLSQPVTSLQLLESVSDPDLAFRAGVVRARAEYALGNYAEAEELLRGRAEKSRSLSELLFGSLFSGAARLGRGMPAESIAEEAARLRQAGERLALEDSLEATNIRTQTRESASLLDLMVMSVRGQYRLMQPLIDSVLSNRTALPDSEARFNTAFALTMDAERLCAQGFPRQAVQRAEEAFGVENLEDYDVLFLPEMIILRQLTAALCAGDLQTVEQIMEVHSIDSGPLVVSFGGGANAARGLGLIRQGLLMEAVQILLPGIQALRLSDPQQLLGCSTAMAVYAAAKTGQHALASELLLGYEAKPSMFVVTAHEQVFLAAGREYMKHDGVGLEALTALAASYRSEGNQLLELNALALAVELGDVDKIVSMTEVASVVEGPWAAALHEFGCAAMASHEERQSGLAAKPARHRTILQHAEGGPSLTVSDPWRVNHRDGSREGKNDGDVTESFNNLGFAMPMPESQPRVAARLTRREGEIASLASAGYSDREIAESLHLSIRTIEGHLYRCYAKLRVRGRGELPAVIPDTD